MIRVVVKIIMSALVISCTSKVCVGLLFVIMMWGTGILSRVCNNWVILRLVRMRVVTVRVTFTSSRVVWRFLGLDS